jgi:hypothetical protein
MSRMMSTKRSLEWRMKFGLPPEKPAIRSGTPVVEKAERIRQPAKPLSVTQRRARYLRVARLQHATRPDDLLLTPAQKKRIKKKMGHRKRQALLRKRARTASVTVKKA